tara:strand:- start:1263 stop:1451 length:189 start_codon:yes stop_codon:yes gene_type:complete
MKRGFSVYVADKHCYKSVYINDQYGFQREFKENPSKVAFLYTFLGDLSTKDIRIKRRKYLDI